MTRLSAQAIDNELVAVLCSDAIGYSTVTNYFRQRHFPSTLRSTPDEPAATVIDNAILDAPEKQPFSSIHELSQLTSTPQGAMSPPQDGFVRDMIQPPSIEVFPLVVASLRQASVEHVHI
jgi:hypothetical protein